MSGIGGYFVASGPPVDPVALEAMAAAISHRGPDGSGVWQAENVGLCNCLLHTTPESLHENLPLYDQESAIAITVDGRIDNRQELIDIIGINKKSSGPVTDSEIILAAYRKWQEDCAGKLIGDFAFVIWDAKNHKLFCARDHMGVKPFFYYWDGKLFIFCSEIKGLFSLLDNKPGINQQRVLDLLVFYYSDPKSTYYKNIYRLPRASMLRITASGLRESCYWSFDPDKRITLSSDAEYAEAFKEIFTEAVSCRLRSHFPVGSTLSGGLDSSSIACVACNLLGKTNQKLHTFSAIFPGLSPEELKVVDEHHYMEAVLGGGGCIPHYIEADKLNPLDFLRRQDHEEPMVAFNMYIFDALYEKARQNKVRVFLDGEDGDTTVSYGSDRLYDLGMKMQFSALISEARAFTPLGAKELYVYRIMKEYALKPRLSKTVLLMLSRLGIGAAEDCRGPDISVLNNTMKGACDWQKRAEEIDGPAIMLRDTAHVKHLSALLSPFLQNIMEDIDSVAGKYPVECRYPFWDRRLMEFCLAIPVEQKMSGGVTRLVLRRAMKNIIPDEVFKRLDKSNLSPNFDRHLKDGAASIFETCVYGKSNLAQYVDTERLRAKAADFSDGRASSEDTASLYTLAALGQWLTKNG